MKAGVIVSKLQPVLNGFGDEVRDVAEDAAARLVDPTTVVRRLVPDADLKLEAALDEALRARSSALAPTPADRRVHLTRICGLAYLLLCVNEAERGGDVVEAEMADFHARKRELP